MTGARYSDSTVVVPKVSVEGIATVTPTRMTDPRQTRRVLTWDHVGLGIFRRCFNVVQYYMKEKKEDSGWLVAGWFKETLGRALSEQPMICGRLQKTERNEGGLEIVSNDSGVRLIEATVQMNLLEFLDLKPREEAEVQLVFWEDIDEQNPQFSLLFYVQVTNFECGGYSIGISCSILLVDLLLRTKFLETWANIHNKVVNENNERKPPLFYLPGLKSTTGSTVISSSTSNNKPGKTTIFKVNSETHNLEIEWCRRVALACVEEADKNEIGTEMPVEFLLFVNESFESIKAESRSKHGMSRANVEVSCENWDGLGANDVSFRRENKPVRVSYWFRSISGHIVVIPSREEDQDACMVNIIVTVPNERFCEK
ncbi:hydroxycinnamoyltransferase-like [Hibiscus syriacus]|uniref:hydroxycinnamoyltransferase-like n=1 Tax=Hibiscus syriacus TaxID=106335 RepID=UPI001923B2FE|nr:hydroxycinnamoyltransferase-like [Hibiscus syriacus]